jgi:predicted nucleic acid-binding protein
MRQYLLDSNIVAAYLLGRLGAKKLARTWILNNEAATSILVYGEVYEYLKGLPDAPKHLVALRTFMKKVHPYPLTYPLLEQYADIRRAMRPLMDQGLLGT